MRKQGGPPTAVDKIPACHWNILWLLKIKDGRQCDESLIQPLVIIPFICHILFKLSLQAKKH